MVNRMLSRRAFFKVSRRCARPLRADGSVSRAYAAPIRVVTPHRADPKFVRPLVIPPAMPTVGAGRCDRRPPVPTGDPSRRVAADDGVGLRVGPSLDVQLSGVHRRSDQEDAGDR